MRKDRIPLRFSLALLIVVAATAAARAPPPLQDPVPPVSEPPRVDFDYSRLARRQNHRGHRSGGRSLSTPAGPPLSDYQAWCPSGAPIFNSSPIVDGAHAAVYRPHASDPINVLLLPVEIGQGSFPVGYVGVLKSVLATYGTFLDDHVSLGRTTTPNGLSSKVSPVYDGSSHLSELTGGTGQLNSNAQTFFDLFRDAIRAYHAANGDADSVNNICNFRSVAMFVFGDFGVSGQSITASAFYSGFGSVVPWDKSLSDLTDVSIKDSLRHSLSTTLAHEEGHGFGMAHVNTCDLRGTRDPLGYGFRTTNDGTTMTEKCVTYGSPRSVMGNGRVESGVSPCLLLISGSIHNDQIIQQDIKCSADATNAGQCQRETKTLAPFDVSSSGKAETVAWATLTRLGTPAYRGSRTRSIIQFLGDPFNCSTVFADDDPYKAYNEAAQQVFGCFNSDDESSGTANQANWFDDVSKRQDALILGYDSKHDGLLFHVWKGTRSVPPVPMASSTEWKTLREIYFIDAVEVNAAQGMVAPEDDAEDGVFISLGTTLSSCWIGNDLSNNIHITFVSSASCDHDSTATCANVIIDRNDPRTFAYSSIGMGYCASKVNLPEGAYPPVLDDVGHPLRVPNDRKRECMFRCLQAYPRTRAFYLRANDDSCTCAKPEGDGCVSPIIPSSWPEGYHAYRIEVDLGTLPLSPLLKKGTPPLISVSTGEWSNVVSSTLGQDDIDKGNVQGILLKSLPSATFFDIGASHDHSGSSGQLKIKHPGLFVASVITTDTKGRVSHGDILFKSDISQPSATSSDALPIEARTSDVHAITSAGFVLTSALAYSASVTFPASFAPDDSSPSYLSLLRWNGLSVRIVFSTVFYFWISTTGNENVERWGSLTADPFSATPAGGSYWTTRSTSASLAGRTVHFAFTTTNEIARVYTDGVFDGEFDWPSFDKTKSPSSLSRPIDAAQSGPSPLFEASYYGTPFELEVTDSTYYNFWLTREAVALSRGESIVLSSGAEVCNEPVESAANDIEIKAGDHLDLWLKGKNVDIPGSTAFSYVCANPVDYSGSTRYTNGASKSTCDAALRYWTAEGLALHNFARTRKCGKEEMSDSAKSIFRWIADLGCCGEGKRMCCDGGEGATCKSVSVDGDDNEDGDVGGIESRNVDLFFVILPACLSAVLILAR